MVGLASPPSRAAVIVFAPGEQPARKPASGRFAAASGSVEVGGCGGYGWMGLRPPGRVGGERVAVRSSSEQGESARPTPFSVTCFLRHIVGWLRSFTARSDRKPPESGWSL